jgi:hypothetical protein
MMSSASHGLILAGMQSGDGKTAVTCMLLAALSERGLAIQPLRWGPTLSIPDTTLDLRVCRRETWISG